MIRIVAALLSLAIFSACTEQSPTAEPPTQTTSTPDPRLSLPEPDSSPAPAHMTRKFMDYWVRFFLEQEYAYALNRGSVTSLRRLVYPDHVEQFLTAVETRYDDGEVVTVDKVRVTDLRLVTTGTFGGRPVFDYSATVVVPHFTIHDQAGEQLYEGQDLTSQHLVQALVDVGSREPIVWHWDVEGDAPLITVPAPARG